MFPASIHTIVQTVNQFSHGQSSAWLATYSAHFGRVTRSHLPLFSRSLARCTAHPFPSCPQGSRTFPVLCVFLPGNGLDRRSPRFHLLWNGDQRLGVMLCCLSVVFSWQLNFYYQRPLSCSEWKFRGGGPTCAQRSTLHFFSR
jgi:hypothetical protein